MDRIHNGIKKGQGVSAQIGNNRGDFSLSQTACLTHKQQKLNCVSWDKNQEFAFKCFQCIIDGSVNPKTLIDFDQILGSNESTMFSNFPFSDPLMKKLGNLSTQPQLIEQLKDTIEYEIKELRQKINHRIDKIKEKLYEQVNVIDSLKKEIVAFNNKFSGKSELNKIITSKEHKTIQDKSAAIKSFFDETLRKSVSKESKFQEAFNLLDQIITKAKNFQDFNTIIDQFSQSFDSLNLKFPQEASIKMIQTLKKEQIEQLVEEDLSNFKMTRLAMKMAPSEYNDSISMTIKKSNIMTTIEVEPKKYRLAGSQRLDNAKGYMVRVHLNKSIADTEPGFYVIGLHLLSNLNSDFQELKDTFGFYSSEASGVSIVRRGQELTTQQNKSKLVSLEFRWCIEKQLCLFSDLQYENVNQVEPKRINPKGEFCFSALYAKFTQSNHIRFEDFYEIHPDQVEPFRPLQLPN